MAYSFRKEPFLTVGAVVAGVLVAAKIMRDRRAIDFTDKVVLITGGSRGLGLLIARELGQQGAKIVLVAREQDELDRAVQELSAQDVDVVSLAADISREHDAARIVTETVARHGRLDVVINNAGVIKVGPLDHMSESDFTEAMDTHFWGPFHTIRAAIPHLRNARGRIVNISSIGGKLGVPHLIPYCASKFALTGLSTSLRAELTRDGIFVTTVSPGLMRTGSPFNAWFKGQHRQEFAWFAIADSLPLLTAEGRSAALQVIDALKHGDAELIITWPAKLAVAINAVLPNTVAETMSLVNRFLPGPAGPEGDESHSGWQSTSSWAPSVLTRPTERSAIENNELP
jgi:NAD(P)-dependent dehydrogenase (short-subunit alcohol dehydrogenase family)